MPEEFKGCITKTYNGYKWELRKKTTPTDSFVLSSGYTVTKMGAKSEIKRAKKVRDSRKAFNARPMERECFDVT